MKRDEISEIGIDETGRLYVVPKHEKFPYIYREAMEIHWDSNADCLYAPPPPRGQLESSIWWFKRILAAAREQACQLYINTGTRWHNVPQTLRDEISAFMG